MPSSWDDLFETWANPPSATQQQKAQRAESAVRAAIDASSTLADHRVSVFSQGSYRNRTNIREESDVDICVFCDETFFFHLPPDTSPDSLGIITPGPYPYATFKQDVGNALASHFPQGTVTRGGKAFDVHENTYRIDADVIPCFEYRYYPSAGQRIDGTGFVPDGSNGFVHNFPEQNYQTGVAKNDATRRRFKAIVRVLKSLRYSMQDAGIAAVNPTPSFLIECLVSNVADPEFNRDLLANSVRNVLADIWHRTGDGFVYKDWLEVNGIKYLFHGAQGWTREQARNFILAAWRFVGFE